MVIPQQKAPVQPRRPHFGTFDDSVLAIDNDTYAIKDLFLKDRRGVIQQTVSVTQLHPLQSTRGHSHAEFDEVYTFTEGMGLMNVDGDPFFVKPGLHVYIEKGKWHQVTNTSTEIELVFICYYPSEIKRNHLK
jgi:mannose-6-phosphate isomerase-like protein (cupin superfamily)